MHSLDRIFRRDFRILPNGVVEHITGSTNVRSSLANRFSVYPSSVPFRPAYGTLLKRYSSEPITRELENQLEKEVRDSVSADPRIKLVRQTRITANQEGLIQIEVDVVLIGNDANINFQVVI